MDKLDLYISEKTLRVLKELNEGDADVPNEYTLSCELVLNTLHEMFNELCHYEMSLLRAKQEAKRDYDMKLATLRHNNVIATLRDADAAITRMEMLKEKLERYE